MEKRQLLNLFLNAQKFKAQFISLLGYKIIVLLFPYSVSSNKYKLK